MDELGRIYSIINELSDQLAQNQKTTAALQAQAAALKNQAAESGSGFALRRFNTDIANETFESELERSNAQIVIENQSLLHENKQLSILLKEYENTLETVMTKFRNHSLASQQYELNLTRHYEALLMTRETQALSHDLASDTEIAHSVQRVAHLLRATLRAMAGEDPDPDLEYEAGEYIDPTDLLSLVDALDGTEAEEEGRADWAVEREAEIARLEEENAALRRMLGIDPETLERHGVTLDLDREPGRYAAILSSRRRSGSGHMHQGSGDGPRMSYWDNAQVQQQQQQQQMQQQQQQQMQQQQPQPYPPQQPQQMQPQQQQRAMDMQPMMRAGPATRRPGMFGAGRGMVPGAMGPAPPNLWNQQMDNRGWQTTPPEFSR